MRLPGKQVSGVIWESATGSNILATASTEAFGTEVVGDTDERFTLSADGRMAWGSGSAPSDTGWTRNGPGRMEINNGTPGTFADLKMKTLLVTDAAGTGAGSITTITDQ